LSESKLESSQDRLEIDLLGKSILESIVMLNSSLARLAVTAVAILLSLAGGLLSATAKAQSPYIGRWDLTVKGADGEYPSWIEIKLSGHRTLVGSYVGQFGSARPISHIKVAEGKMQFVVPPQWEDRTSDVVVEGKFDSDRLVGTVTDDKGQSLSWTAVRAPDLKPAMPPQWGEPIELFNGKDLSGWKSRSADGKHGWKVTSGAMFNEKPGQDLLTEKKFGDFKLTVEFRYPAGSNSGIYLRGRYEVQIEDNFGREPDSHYIGGVYGHLTPCRNASKPAGEWQKMEITLIGREVDVTLNGEHIIDRQTIPGITGGAFDSREGEKGPVLLQGDHGVVEYRKVTITPAVE
jgi:hypothetical protein